MSREKLYEAAGRAYPMGEYGMDRHAGSLRAAVDAVLNEMDSRKSYRATDIGGDTDEVVVVDEPGTYLVWREES